MGDTLGQRGLQLFVDAGQPVNSNLVNALVREVIAEKVGSMLGRRKEVDATDAESMAARRGRGPGVGGGASAEVVEEETDFVRVRLCVCMCLCVCVFVYLCIFCICECACLCVCI